jgi:hypothetical protein
MEVKWSVGSHEEVPLKESDRIEECLKIVIKISKVEPYCIHGYR